MLDAKPTFAEFYRLYPRKKKPLDAEKAWGQMLKKGFSPEEIISGLRRNLPELQRRDPQFVPYPASWLRAGEWGNEPDPQPSRPQPMQRRAGDMGGFAQEFLERLDAQQSGMDRRDNESAYGSLAYSPVARRH